MKINTEVTWSRQDIENLLRAELERSGLAPRDFAGDDFHWVVTGATEENPNQSLEIDVTAICDIAPEAIASPPTPDRPKVLGVAPSAPPKPTPTQPPPKTLSKEELNELANLLPHPEFANQILNSKAVVREMFPGESRERPD